MGVGVWSPCVVRPRLAPRPRADVSGRLEAEAGGGWCCAAAPLPLRRPAGVCITRLRLQPFPCPALPLPCPALPCYCLSGALPPLRQKPGAAATPCPALPCPALPCPALPCPALRPSPCALRPAPACAELGVQGRILTTGIYYYDLVHFSVEYRVRSACARRSSEGEHCFRNPFVKEERERDRLSEVDFARNGVNGSFIVFLELEPCAKF